MFDYEIFVDFLLRGRDPANLWEGSLAGFTFVEVGVNEPEKSVLGKLSERGAQVILVEPLDFCARNLRAAFPKAEVIEAAVTKTTGKCFLYDRGEGSFLIGTQSPDVVHGKIGTPNEKFIKEVNGISMADIDPGDINILHLDIEGSEWLAIQNLKSRPPVIGVETHLAFHEYRNPHLAEIETWMEENQYRKLCETIADTIWVAP